MQWFIDLIKDWVIAQAYATMAWVLGYCPKARAYQPGDQVIPDHTWSRITFAAESYDTHSLFADYKFTVAVAGYYAVILTIHLRDPGDGTYFYAGIYKNGTAISVKLVHASSDDSVGSTATDIIYLEAGDYIEGYCFHSAPAARYTIGGSKYTFMAITQIF